MKIIKYKPKVQIKFRSCREVKLSLNQTESKKPDLLVPFPLVTGWLAQGNLSFTNNPSGTFKNFSLRSKLGF